jgi:glutamate N-acetyltransferase / amino-acid N-acetyltransferase
VSVVAADGFVASGAACGIKPSGDTDLALVATADGAPAAAAGAFTQNLVVAAPVTVSRRHLAATGSHRKETVMRGEGSSSAGWGTVVSRGCVGVEHDTGAVAAHMAGEYLEVLCDLAVGEGEARVLTNDLTYGYIDENRGTS